MKAILCDHCKKQLDLSDNSDDFPNENDTIMMTDFNFDLCRKCYDELCGKLYKVAYKFLNIEE